MEATQKQKLKSKKLKSGKQREKKSPKPRIDAIERKARACAQGAGSREQGAKFGRPTVYLQSFCKDIIEFMARGYSLTAFAGQIGVSRETIYEWAESKPDFSDAVARARAARTFYWEKRLQIAGQDAPAVKWALKNTCRDEWRDDPDVAVTVNNDVAVDLSKPPEEWGEAELRAELEKRGALLKAEMLTTEKLKSAR